MSKLSSKLRGKRSRKGMQTGSTISVLAHNLLSRGEPKKQTRTRRDETRQRKLSQVSRRKR